ncbi:MAG: uroporphyrinogen-III synthase [Micropepsaceae bacterium]
MRLLITRPKDAAMSIAAALSASGHTPLIAPVMDINIRDGEPLILDGIQAILATSANGVRALTQRSEDRKLPLYAVGPQTEEAAREAGFHSVHSANGDAAAMAEKVIAELDPTKGALFHAAGAETAGRLAETLRAQNFIVESDILYDALPVSKLPDIAASALRENLLDGVLVFSPRTAKIFTKLILEADMTEKCAPLHAFCISAATAAALGSLEFTRVAVAGNPNQEAMLALFPKENN